MSDGVNRTQVLGNLGADPELRYTATGEPVMNFRMATTETWLKNGEKKSRTDWHSCVVWGKRAEALAKILKKGSRVLAEGPSRTSSYESEGIRRWKTEIVVQNLILLGAKPAHDHARPDDDGREQEDPPGDNGAGDDIPY